MPELPDIEVYLFALQPRVVGRRLARLRLMDPFLLRSVEPEPEALEGKTCVGVRRIGKRIVFEFDGELFAVLHLMIAGRLQWAPVGDAKAKKTGLAFFEFDSGRLSLTEAGSKRRASLHLFAGAERLRSVDPGGLEPLGSSFEDFWRRLTSANHTLKRMLTDPRVFSGVGNAYSDEILHRARLSPLALTQKLAEVQGRRLHAAMQTTLRDWWTRLQTEVGDGFPTKVTAFRPEMAVHGRFGLPCPDCGKPVQRIVYAENETNYCAQCQTGGKVLADRSLSRLLKDDWPRTLEEWERTLGS
jgi:formamidopyrimidine-DNA glycosylase